MEYRRQRLVDADASEDTAFGLEKTAVNGYVFIASICSSNVLAAILFKIPFTFDRIFSMWLKSNFEMHPHYRSGYSASRRDMHDGAAGQLTANAGSFHRTPRADSG